MHELARIYCAIQTKSTQRATHYSFTLATRALATPSPTSRIGLPQKQRGTGISLALHSFSAPRPLRGFRSPASSGRAYATSIIVSDLSRSSSMRTERRPLDFPVDSAPAAGIVTSISHPQLAFEHV